MYPDSGLYKTGRIGQSAAKLLRNSCFLEEGSTTK